MTTKAEAIYYFSGTGNSATVAHHLGMLLKCPVYPMLGSEFPTSVPSALGLVFPVYAWGPPQPVLKFVQQLSLLSAVPSYLWAVMTCGDDVGYADRVLNENLRRELGKQLDAVWSVPMPNTYVCLPGFQVDDDVLATSKLSETACLLPRVAQQVQNRETVCNVVRGAAAWFKTGVLRVLFQRWLITDRPFRVDASRCVSCGQCQRVCPVGNVRLIDGMVKWAGACVGCLACYHACPQRAIDWGRFTRGKGQHRIARYSWPAEGEIRDKKV